MGAERKVKPVVIVGAGVSGLLAAERLQEAGKEVMVLERSKAPGGRLATERVGDGVFDQGAQFFTSRSDEFRAIVRKWTKARVAEVWCNGFRSGNGRLLPDGQPRYKGVGGMAAIMNHVSQGLNVKLGAEVVRIEYNGGAWQVRMAGGSSVAANVLIMTPPVPESLALMDAGNVTLSSDVRKHLESTRFEPCFAVLALLKGPSRVEEPGLVRMPSDSILWITDNHVKGISPDAFAVTIHASPNFSRQYLNDDPGMIAKLLLGEAHEWLGSETRDVHVTRWLYAQPVRVHPEPYLAVTEPGMLVFSGDAFGGPRVEGAALSGLAAAHAVTQRF